ncbi:MAG: 3-isopropylmalate dehydratase small subunit [Microbacteriaceae bacterium]
MEKFEVVTGVALPLVRSNVDTDQIIPAVFLKRVTKTGYDDALFYAWRKEEDFILNQPAYQGAQILIAGPEFGTGSSREHAVCALRDYGFKAVFSSKFADIFRGNSGKQGLLAGVIEQDKIEELWAAIEAQPGIEATVDLLAKQVKLGNLTVDFEIDDYTRWRLLEGLDDIGLTLQDEASITQFEELRESWLPKTLPVKD